MKIERYNDPRITYAFLSHILCRKAVSRLVARLPGRITATQRQWMLEPDSDPEAEELLPWMMAAQIVFPAGSPEARILLWLGGGEADAYWKVRGNYGAWGLISGFVSEWEALEALEELHRILEGVVNEFYTPVPEDEPLYPPFMEEDSP
jgi:hypothetical protein